MRIVLAWANIRHTISFFFCSKQSITLLTFEDHDAENVRFLLTFFGEKDDGSPDLLHISLCVDDVDMQLMLNISVSLFSINDNTTVIS